ncbi:MFS general substrate transporter [Glonium stellatum]|uniref:MFS general substrate transporter n=1 Tax=Glonium stellatum TaxID=574774 RepID=A0A8E2JN86_9PEZI|nr:MFS general substrate transporter [Glonium stellatum]
MNTSDTLDKDRPPSGPDTTEGLDPTGPVNDLEKQNPETAPNPNLVGWDEPESEDTSNPKDWSTSQKWIHVGILSSVTFLTPLASSMFAPGVPQVMNDFRATSNLLSTSVVSVFVLGFAFGPPVLAPLSEMYGRIPIYNTCNQTFLVFTILSAEAKNMGMLVAVKFLTGVFGVAVIACGSGPIADMMSPEQRGGAMAVWAVGPILGPVIGPVAGGFLVIAKGWRWVFWVISILSGIIAIIAALFLRETYAPVLLERKAKKLRKETGNPDLQSNLTSELTGKQLFAHSIIRPTKMVVRSPIISLMCVYTAVTYGLLYILFTTFTFVFEDAGVGTIIGLLFVGIFSDRALKKVIAIEKATRPENRLVLHIIVPAALSIPVGLFTYGWSTDKHVHWIVPEIGTAVVGFGMISLVMCIRTFCATAANAVLRSLLGALLPLCGLNMYDVIGLGCGNSLLAFVALALAPVPWFFRFYGERIRTNLK